MDNHKDGSNSHTGTGVKAYSYLRFSTPDQMKGDSFRRQTELTRQYAEENGLELDDSLSFHDLGVSAFRGKNVDEGELGAFLEAVDKGKVKPGSYLLVESLDRLSRQTAYRAFKQFSDILDRGINIITLHDRKTYSAGAGDGLAFSDLVVSLAVMQRAHEESLTKSRRLASAWEQKRKVATQEAEDGGRSVKPLTSRCPEWLSLNKQTEKFEVIEERAEIIRRVYSMTLEGIGKNTIARTLNAEGVPSFRSDRGKGIGWHESYVSKVLLNEAVIGRYQPHRMEESPKDGRRRRQPVGEPLDGYYPAIVATADFARVQHMRMGRKIPAGKVAAKYSNLFTGLCQCGVCGGPMHYEDKGPRPKGGSYLICSHAKRNLGCPSFRWRYSETQAHILLNLLELDFRDLFPSLYAKGKEELNRLEGLLATKEREQNEVEVKLANIAGHLERMPDSGTLLDRLVALERQKAELSKGVEGIRFQIGEEKERLAGAGKAYGDVGDALERFIEIERTAHGLEQEHQANGLDDAASEELKAAREERLTARRRVFQLLQKCVDKIVFTPAMNPVSGEEVKPSEAEHGTITVSFKGMGEAAPVSIVVLGKKQRDSRGYVNTSAGEPTGKADVFLVDESWPPTGRILSGKGLERLLFRRGSSS
jgi:DNA invertase Pin-like site-specific DNA recombinase